MILLTALYFIQLLFAFAALADLKVTKREFWISLIPIIPPAYYITRYLINSYKQLK